MPGDVLIDLYNAGEISDPYFAKNAENCLQYLKEKMEYTGTLTLEKLAKKVNLVFEGVDTYAEVYCNGQMLGRTENMFLRYEFDITPFARVGENEIKVCLLPVWDFVDKEDHGRGVFNRDRLQLRKAQCHFGWDWAPHLPGYGIWLPAYAEISDGCMMKSVDCNPSLDGTVHFVTEIEGAGEISVDIDGKNYGTFPVKEGTNEITVQVAETELWWPNGYGKQKLYEYTLSLKVGEIVHSIKTAKFAFRDIAVIEDRLEDGRIGFGFKVNGVRIFAKGSNWVPCSNQTGAICDEEYKTLLAYAKDGNYNIIRVWGGGIYEKEIFYELCDEYGILVWQDMMFACQDAPQNTNIEERIKPELAYQLVRIRQHPCVAVICGGNEWASDNPYKNEPLISVLSESSKKYAPKIRFVPNSPFGYEEGSSLYSTSSGDTHVSAWEFAYHNGEPCNFRKYIDKNRAQFYSECACLGSCRLRSLKKFIPETELWLIGDAINFHFVRHPFVENPEETYASTEKEIAEAFFGKIDTVEDFAKKSMIAHSELLAAEMDYARANKDCYGFLNWMFNDNWGCGTWSVIDKYMEKKPVYYAQKRGYKAIVLRYVFLHNEWGLYLANDAVTDYQGRLSYGVKRIDGTVVTSCEVDVRVKAGEVLKVATVSQEDGDYRYAYLEDGTDKTICYLKPFDSFKWKTDLETRFVKEEGGGITIAIKAKEFARCVFIDHEKVIACSDNYFDLEKMEEREVFIKELKESDFPKLKITTFADTWTE